MACKMQRNFKKIFLGKKKRKKKVHLIYRQIWYIDAIVTLMKTTNQNKNFLFEQYT